MKLTLQKRLAAQIKKISPKKIRLNPENHAEIKEALTKSDIRGLLNKGIIKTKHEQESSRYRARKLKEQKKKGRKKGMGSRKGTKTARKPRKRTWIEKIRVQREFLRLLKSKTFITRKDYRILYKRANSGFFRSRRHIKTYISERGLTKDGKK